MKYRLNQRVAIITGGASGIGRACALRLAEAGASVHVADIQEEAGREAAHICGGHFHRLDVSREADWQAAVGTIMKQSGRLDILINCAGITGDGPQNPETTSLDAWRAVMAVNLEGPMLGCRYALKAMQQRPAGEPITGSIVNIVSRAAQIGIPTAIAYAASKAGLHSLTKSVALYCASRDWKIRCNSIHPAVIDTPMWDPFLGADPAGRTQAMARFTNRVPLREAGHPDDVAWAAVYLCSDEARYITGTELVVDGGMLAGEVQ